MICQATVTEIVIKAFAMLVLTVVCLCLTSIAFTIVDAIRKPMERYVRDIAYDYFDALRKRRSERGDK